MRYDRDEHLESAKRRIQEMDRHPDDCEHGHSMTDRNLPPCPHCAAEHDAAVQAHRFCRTCEEPHV